MDFNLSEEQKALRECAGRFAEKKVKPRAREIDRRSEWPSDLVEEMAELDFFGLPYPPKYKGIGAGYMGYVLVLEQLAGASMTVAAIIAIDALTEEAIFRYGNEEQKKEFLVPLVQGEHLAMYAFTEAATGTDPKMITTTAYPKDDVYILEGSKTFSSLAPGAGIALVYAKDESGRVSAFITDPSSQGFVIDRHLETMGLRGLGACAISFQGVPVPKGNLLGEKGKGYDILVETINIGQLGIASECVGLAEAALEMSLNYAPRRRVGNGTMADLLTTQSELGEMAANIEAARWLTYRTAFLRDEGDSIRKDVAIAKLFASQMAVRVTSMAMQIHGSYGYTKELDVERLYRDAKVTEIYEVVSEIQRLIIARYLVNK